MIQDRLFNDFISHPYYKDSFLITTKNKKDYHLEIIFNIIERRYNEYSKVGYLIQRYTLSTPLLQRQPITRLGLPTLPFINEYLSDDLIDELLKGDTILQRKKIIKQLYGKWIDINCIQYIKSIGNKIVINN